MKTWMWYSYKLEYPQPLVDSDFVLPKLITDKVLKIYGTVSPTLLEFFHTVQMKKSIMIYRRIITNIWSIFEWDNLMN